MEMPSCRCDIHARFYGHSKTFCHVKVIPCKTLSGEILKRMGWKTCGGKIVDCASAGDFYHIE